MALESLWFWDPHLFFLSFQCLTFTWRCVLTVLALPAHCSLQYCLPFAINAISHLNIYILLLHILYLPIMLYFYADKLISVSGYYNTHQEVKIFSRVSPNCFNDLGLNGTIRDRFYLMGARKTDLYLTVKFPKFLKKMQKLPFKSMKKHKRFSWESKLIISSALLLKP